MWSLHKTRATVRGGGHHPPTFLPTLLLIFNSSSLLFTSFYFFTPFLLLFFPTFFFSHPSTSFLINYLIKFYISIFNFLQTKLPRRRSSKQNKVNIKMSESQWRRQRVPFLSSILEKSCFEFFKKLVILKHQYGHWHIVEFFTKKNNLKN